MIYDKPKLNDLFREEGVSAYCANGSSAIGTWAGAYECDAGGDNNSVWSCLSGTGNQRSVCSVGTSPGSSHCNTGTGVIDSVPTCYSGTSP